ncbi:MAG: hypothetical protein AAF614_38295 [Chloroflexota bacterium]
MLENFQKFYKDLRKAIDLWSSRLTRTGKIILVAAIIGFVWLLLQTINGIFGIVPTLGELGLGILAVILNIVAILLVAMVVAQIGFTYYTYQEAQKSHREMIVRGRRGGNRMEQMSGRRHRGSGQRKSARSANMRVAPDVSADQINRHFPHRWMKKPDLVAEWKDIKEAGIYALEETPKEKIEILDAKEIGGGFYLGTWSGRFVPQRSIVTNKAGKPINYATLRHAKKQIQRSLNDAS